MTQPSRLRAAAALVAVVVVIVTLPYLSATATEAPQPARGVTGPLANFDHLDWLQVSVDPPAQEGHTTYRMEQQPHIGTLWTYAEPGADGDYEHVGGGTYDPATDTWGQGAYNADDMTRAAVAYLRHWQATGSASSRDSAYDLLRGVTYLQTSSGPDAGNVVLWMQPDGTLNPSAEPVEQPDPSDSGASYWLARTVWALGEGYGAFRDEDPAFASFLRARLELAIDAIDRQVLDEYDKHLSIDGERTPAWLIVDGADATAEAMLGLSAYVGAGGSAHARTVLARLSEGVAAMTGGDARTWPFGAVRPWALSRSVWHGWGSQMPAALAEASGVLGEPALQAGPTSDAFTFDPWLLTSGGPDNGRLPTRGDRSQIAYGVDSRLQSLVATAEATGRTAARRLAGIMAAWYFGANPTGEPMYDPATGRTFDGVNADGTVNRNSGAESTVHGLLSMLLLDANPGIAAQARIARIEERVGTTTLQGEDAALAGKARAVEPESLWTGEALFGGTGYAGLGSGGTASFTLPEHPQSLVLPVLDRHPGSTARTAFRAGEQRLGVAHSGAVGPQGASPAPGALLPTTLPETLPAGATALSARTSGDGQDAARLDAVMLQPLVSRLVLRGDDHGTALLSSASDRAERSHVRVAGSGPAVVEAYDGQGRLVDVRTSPVPSVPVTVPAGGFTIVRR